MARYYDMDKLKEMIEAKAGTLIEGKEAFLCVAKWLDLLPPADVVEVIRCKDCRHCISPDRGYPYCSLMSNAEEGEYYTTCDDHYCGCGERK